MHHGFTLLFFYCTSCSSPEISPLTKQEALVNSLNDYFTEIGVDIVNKTDLLIKVEFTDSDYFNKDEMATEINKILKKYDFNGASFSPMTKAKDNNSRLAGTCTNQWTFYWYGPWTFYVMACTNCGGSWDCQMSGPFSECPNVE